MTAANLISVLRPLCECDPPEISAQAIAESEDAPDLAALVQLGALRPTSNSDTVLCLACDAPHPVGVEYLGDGRYQAYCPDAGFQAIDAGLLCIFAIDLNWIADSIAESVGLSARRTRSAYPEVPLARIGRVRFGKYPPPRKSHSRASMICVSPTHEADVMEVRHLNQVQVARRWGISERTLERWRWRRQGPPFLKIGGHVAYRLSDIEDYERGNVRTAITTPADSRSAG